QILCAETRCLRDLRLDDRHPDLASARPVWPRGDTVSAMSDATQSQIPSQAVSPLARRAMLAGRWRWQETVFWLVLASSYVVFQDRYLILTEIAWLALFALSLDLIMGYAGIVSLGHAAFFGVGAYSVGLLAK